MPRLCAALREICLDVPEEVLKQIPSFFCFCFCFLCRVFWFQQTNKQQQQQQQQQQNKTKQIKLKQVNKPTTLQTNRPTSKQLNKQTITPTAKESISYRLRSPYWTDHVTSCLKPRDPGSPHLLHVSQEHLCLSFRRFRTAL